MSNLVDVLRDPSRPGQMTLRRRAADEIERLRAALKRLIGDYEDVPDPTDADGQAVFEDARRALEGK